ncbi:MAG: ATP-dependent sacrificial sulfur transferase LarE [Desulfobulbaceae bacterium]
METGRKEHKLISLLASRERLGVAFSGGADSSLLLHKAIEVLGPENVLVLTARSRLLKKGDIENVSTWLTRHGHADVRHEFVDLDPLSWEEFVANPSDRCYRCKLRVYDAFFGRMREMGISFLADGTNHDDMHSDRPGLRALDELSVFTPLAEAELTKEEIRALGRACGLDTWDRPSASCLATRIPAGLPVTHIRLRLIDEIEAWLEDRGFSGCRARLDLHDPARLTLQLAEEDMVRLSSREEREEHLRFFNDFGMKQVCLDLRGR